MDVLGLAFWGLLGAFVYAAPRFVISVAGGKLAMPMLEGLVALAIGPISAAGFGQFLGATVHQTSIAELRAIAVVIGMISNPVASR